MNPTNLPAVDQISVTINYNGMPYTQFYDLRMGRDKRVFIEVLPPFKKDGAEAFFHKVIYLEPKQIMLGDRCSPQLLSYKVSVDYSNVVEREIEEAR
ncbi:MAG TPA: hypothetical protein VKC60_08245 [Opitutaceae bacterium]|nr:hypothetical protein [Opitutaceae bacterium]